MRLTVTFDSLGRNIQTLGPTYPVDGTDVRTAKWTVYLDDQFTTWSCQGFATGSSSSYAYTLVNPVSINITDADGNATDLIQAVSSSTVGPLAPSFSFPQSSWVSWTHQVYNDGAQLIAKQAYFDIPASGSGGEGTNYYETDYGYDSLGRQNRVVSPTGTITRSVLDAQSRVLGIYVGTNDTSATDTDPTGGGTAGNNMVQITANQYPTGCDCTQPATLTQFVDATTMRVTTYTYDFRNRQVTIAGELSSFQQSTYDNLNRAIEVDQYDGSTNGNLIARSQTFYDPRGNVYQAIRYGVDPSTGTVGNPLTSNKWYDEAGNLLKSLPAGSQMFSKTFYDSRARAYATYQGYYTGSGTEPYSDVGQITSTNKIFQQALTTYDDAGNAIEVDSYLRFHDAIATGPLNPPYGSDPRARVSYTATWFDGIGRPAATASYGTNNNAAFTRPSSAPATSDTVLVTLQSYDSSGNNFQTTDPAGIVTQRSYDALARVVQTISDYTGAGPGNDHDVTVLMAYNGDGNLVSLTAVNPTTGDQVTQYLYGVSMPASDLASNALQQAVIYPDAVDGEDRVTYQYNRQNQVTTLTDQNGTVHEYLYDLLGRMTDDLVTTLGPSVDGSIQRISRTYEIRGLVQNVTSYEAASGGSVVNDIEYQYNDFQQPVIEYQQHGSAVNPSTSPNVQYSYADGSANTIRPTGITYPSRRTITFNYGASGGDGDQLSQVQALLDADGTTLADYTYLGQGTTVRVDYPQPDLRYDLITGSGVNPYAGLDQFGRVIDSLWLDYGSNLNAEEVQYGYDQASDRLWRHNTVAPSGGNDELYAYDDLHRLINTARGDLADDDTTIIDVSLAQQWDLDATGNWEEFINTDITTPANNLDQLRDSNQANEITTFSQHYGPAWAQPSYDRAGNMTVFPQPLEPTSAFNATYDPWNRLTSVSGAASYSYDGTNRRTTKLVSGTTRHYYYSNQWQVLEERLNTATAPERQFVWGLRYIDDLTLRDRTPSGTGPLSERFYAVQDANWNVTAIADNNGNVQERYQYTAYGMPTVLNPDFSVRIGGSAYDWETLYTGYRCDWETVLYSVRRRCYHTALGTWLSRDPIVSRPTRTGFNFETNLLWYTNDNPISFVDPSGEQRNPFDLLPQKSISQVGCSLTYERGIVSIPLYSFSYPLPRISCVILAIEVFMCAPLIGPGGLDLVPGGCALAMLDAIADQIQYVHASCNINFGCRGGKKCCRLINLKDTTEIALPIVFPILPNNPQCLFVGVYACKVMWRVQIGYCK